MSLLEIPAKAPNEALTATEEGLDIAALHPLDYLELKIANKPLVLRPLGPKEPGLFWIVEGSIEDTDQIRKVPGSLIEVLGSLVAGEPEDQLGTNVLAPKQPIIYRTLVFQPTNAAMLAQLTQEQFAELRSQGLLLHGNSDRPLLAQRDDTVRHTQDPVESATLLHADSTTEKVF